MTWRTRRPRRPPDRTGSGAADRLAAAALEAVERRVELLGAEALRDERSIRPPSCAEQYERYRAEAGVAQSSIDTGQRAPEPRA